MHKKPLLFNSTAKDGGIPWRQPITPQIRLGLPCPMARLDFIAPVGEPAEKSLSRKVRNFRNQQTASK